MKPVVVVDTNVAVVASTPAGQKGPVSRACIRACVRELLAIRGGEKKLALDAEGAIVREYLANLTVGARGGVGGAFLKWVLDNREVPERCDKVVTRTPDGRLPAFPDDPELADFDPSDRKFVAVARAHPAAPPILQATDSKWWGYRRALRRHGVTVDFLCEREVRRTYARKFGREAAEKGGGDA